MKTTQQEMKEQLKKEVKSFFKSAVRRDGGKHTVGTMQCDRAGTPTTVKGTVDVDGKPTEMFWNINGGALGNPNFDLVTVEKL